MFDIKDLKSEEIIKMKQLIQKYKNYDKIDLLIEKVIVLRGIY